MTRREFLHCSAAGATVALACAAPGHGAELAPVVAAAPGPLKAAVLGHTGRGNFGHGLDVVFNDRPGIEVVAVADPDATGRSRAQARARASRAYADYRELLARERPQLVSVAPRWSDQHYALVRAALLAGAHVYCEKPFTRVLAEADDLLALAARTGRKIAVAHQGRLSPATLLLKRRLDEGLLGELLELRVHGKQDRRAGGEDLLVLGTHQFDLVRYFAGEALWCTARVLQGGREVRLADARAATEGIGPVIGDEIDATFGLTRGVLVHYSSRRRVAAGQGPWGIELIGTKGRARLLNDQHTQVYVQQIGELGAGGQSLAWQPLSPESTGPAALAGGTDTANRRVVDDWLAAIREDRTPACGGHDAMKALEMIHAVFAAGIARTRVSLPLLSRAHPLAAA